MKIKSDDRDVRDILGSGFYRIPRFQRPYSWERENITDFWNDTIVDADSDYFIGSMVMYKLGSSTYGIVDGQQRMTTITMILCALRNAFNQEGIDDLAKGIHQLIERKDINNKMIFILSPDSSFPYFQEYIQKFGEPEVTPQVGDEEKNIESAFTLINSQIKAAIDAIKNDTTLGDESKQVQIKSKLISIRDRMLGLKLISVELDDEDDAYIIFETLNTRGKDLNVSDLVKNHLTKMIKKKGEVDTTKLKWEKILSTIQGSSSDINIDGFLHHYWLSKYDYITLKKLFKDIKKSIKKEQSPAFLKELEQDAVTYREIHETTYRKWRMDESAIKQAMDAYSVFRVKQQVPMVLSVMRDYKAEILKKKHVEQILCAIENFHFVFTAVTSQRSSGGISQMYASCAKRLTSEPSQERKIEELKELHAKLKEKLPKQEEFGIYFPQIYYTDNFTKQKQLVKYILSKIHAQQNDMGVFDYSAMTIEHILPQSAIETDAIDDSIVGQIGNLILVPAKLNETLGGKPFLQKKEILSEVGVTLDEIILIAKDWGKSEIVARTKYLTKYAYETAWKF